MAKSEADLRVMSRKQMLTKVDHLLDKLEDYQVLKGAYAKLSEMELTELCNVIPDIFLEDSIIVDLDLSTPLYVIGDLFGQFGDLLRMFKLLGHPPDARFLFLGNYVDRGNRSIETLAYIYALKLKFPKHVYILRGNHECQYVAEDYGFYKECTSRFTAKLWPIVIRTFNYLPVIAIIEEKVFCCHSGMSPNIQLKDISSLHKFRFYLEKGISRPVETTANVLVTHYTWSLPDPDIKDWDENPAGLGYLYGPSVVEDFCQKVGIQFIIRSNEYLEKGYEYSFSGKLLSIFSAPNYLGTFPNDGALVQLTKDPVTQEIKRQIKVVKPIMEMRNKKTSQMNIIITDAIEVENLKKEEIRNNDQVVNKGDNPMSNITD